MTPDPVDPAQVTAALEALRREVARLGERVAALEATAGRKPAAAPAPAPAEGLSEELVLVISAAIAAFLGKAPRIRQIRLLGSAAWSQAGRVTIQASHALPVHHG
jgi:methylmalonyl-CoA carboxyltransferase 12S subunit